MIHSRGSGVVVHFPVETQYDAYIYNDVIDSYRNLPEHSQSTVSAGNGKAVTMPFIMTEALVTTCHQHEPFFATTPSVEYSRCVPRFQGEIFSVSCVGWSRFQAR
jgi:hypothetical protein